MTRDEMEACRKRAEKATAGPWDNFDGIVEERHENGDAYWVDAIVSESDNAAVAITTSDRYADQQHDNAEFIAHARTDIPALLAHVEALKKVREECAKTAEAQMNEALSYKWSVQMLRAIVASCEPHKYQQAADSCSSALRELQRNIAAAIRAGGKA